MNKIINDPDTITRDIMEGYLYLYGKDYEMVPGTFGGMVKKNQQEKVSVIVGGGGGNEPWCLGYVGEGCSFHRKCIRCASGEINLRCEQSRI